jgi:hypothetical protein
VPTALPAARVQPRIQSSSHWRLLLRLLLALAVAGALLPISADGGSPPVRAASNSCTGWEDRYNPPPTIRVGRADGSVETVDFRKYVGVVMAKEWPSWMPVEAMKAGAVAVKQYGWWWTLAGKHRSGYVNASGKCYDVKDSTADQLYKPEKVSVTDKIWRVVDETLMLSVRKSGKFFMTGYRAGKSSTCASDVDGWKLYAKSVVDCAERGWSRERIQLKYYAPDVTFHWGEAGSVTSADLSVAISAPHAVPQPGKKIGKKHVRISWDADKLRPSGAYYQLQRLASGSWNNVSLADPTKPSVVLNLKRGVQHRFRVRLRDSAGNTGTWYTGPEFVAGLVQDKSAAWSWSGNDWQRTSHSKASGGTTTYATKSDSQAETTFTGRAVALVGTLGPKRGKARIYIDGQLESTIDLYAAKNKWKVVVFARDWADVGQHTIRIEVVGTSGRPRVDVDALLVFR